MLTQYYNEVHKLSNFDFLKDFDDTLYKLGNRIEKEVSLLCRTECEVEAKRRANGMKTAIESGMNAMKAMLSAGEREWRAHPDAIIVTPAMRRRG